MHTGSIRASSCAWRWARERPNPKPKPKPNPKPKPKPNPSPNPNPNPTQVGPREAARKRCTLAKTFQAGVPARRLTGVEVGSGLPGRLKELAAVKVEGWEEAFEVQDSGAASAAAAAGELARGDDLEGNLEAPAQGADDEAGTMSKKSTKP